MNNETIPNSNTDKNQSNFTNEQIEHLAEILAEKALELMKDQFYQETGKQFFKGILYLLGLLGVSILYWLNKNNYLQIN